MFSIYMSHRAHQQQQQSLVMPGFFWQGNTALNPNSAICNPTTLEAYLRPSLLARSSQTQSNVLSEHAHLIAVFKK